MTRLDLLEAETIYIIREAYAKLSPLGMLWSIGKDSNSLLWMVRKAFFGRVPLPVILLDTGNELPEVYDFRDKYVKEWGLNYVNANCPSVDETDETLPPAARAAARKTLGLKRALEQHDVRALLLGIRRDEQAVRAKERVFSPRGESGEWDFRDQPPEFWNQYKTEVPPGTHVRVHPLLSWTELDVWHYVKREQIPMVSLYFARNGKRYRSLGEKDITFPIESNAATIDEVIAELELTTASERAGRSMDHESEDAFERLRQAGYM
jgi:sulfate adenylyltransferase subunit 2